MREYLEYKASASAKVRKASARYSSVFFKKVQRIRVGFCTRLVRQLKLGKAFQHFPQHRFHALSDYSSRFYRFFFVFSAR